MQFFLVKFTLMWCLFRGEYEGACRLLALAVHSGASQAEARAQGERAGGGSSGALAADAGMAEVGQMMYRR